jgi:hypothetical protein
MLKIGPLPGKYGEFTPDIGSNEISPEKSRAGKKVAKFTA